MKIITTALLLTALLSGCTTITVEKTGKDTYIAKYSTFWTTKHYEDVSISKEKDGGVTVKFGKVDSVKSESKLLEKLVDRIPVR